MSITVTQLEQTFNPITIKITSPAEAELLQFALSHFIEYGRYHDALRHDNNLTVDNLNNCVKEIIQMRNKIRTLI